MSKLDIQDFNRVLIVEGYSDLRFYAEVFEAVGKHGDVYIKHFNGKSDLVTNLPIFITPLLLAEKIQIGVIADADDNPAGTFIQLQAALEAISGQRVGASGTWTTGSPRLGLLVVPSATTKGEIETLVWQAWSSDNANIAQTKCVETFTKCMTTAGFSAKSPHKGLVGSLLAIRNDDDPRLGPGTQAKVFDLMRPEFEELRNFLAQY
jgi:hypothetical protein